MMKKHAYLIVAHNQFDLLEMLLKMLDDERNDLFVHIDEKVQNFDKKRFTKAVTKSNLIFTDKIPVTWGTYSQMLCTQLLLKTATEYNEHYSYYHLISGVDLPIKSNDDIYEFFDKVNGKELVQCSKEGDEKEYLDRLKRYYYFQSKYVRDTMAPPVRVERKLQQILKVNRLKNNNKILRFGGCWFSITEDFAKYVVSQKDNYEKMFKSTFCADEFYVQTILFNSPFRDRLYVPSTEGNLDQIMRLIDWKRGMPYTFTDNDTKEVLESPMLFARKFNYEKYPGVVNEVFQHVMEKNK